MASISTRARVLSVIAWSVSLGAGASAVHAAVPVGAEFLVNSYTVATQAASTVGVDADGDFVVV
jgi:hypothetical protein